MPKHNGYEYELKQAKVDRGKFGSSVCGLYSLVCGSYHWFVGCIHRFTGHFRQFRAWQEHDGMVRYSMVEKL